MVQSVAALCRDHEGVTLPYTRLWKPQQYAWEICYNRDKMESQCVKVFEEMEENGTQNRDNLIFTRRRKLIFSLKMGKMSEHMAKCVGIVVVGTSWEPHQMANFCNNIGGMVT